MNRNEWLDTLPKNLVWAELGVFLGEYSEEIFSRTNPKKMYLVDIFPEYMISGDKDGNNMKEVDLREVPNVLRSKFPENVVIIKNTSDNFLNSLEHESLDIVYIDADHSYQGVKNDLALSYNKVKKGGLICGHDYSSRFEGVVRAVNEFCQEKNLKINFLSNDVLPTFAIIKE